MKREFQGFGCSKRNTRKYKTKKQTNKPRKREEQHSHFLGSNNPTRKTLASHLLEILKVLSWMCQEVSKVPANNTTPFLQLKTKQRKKVTMNNTIYFKTTSKICILVSGKEDILQRNLRDSPSGSVAESGVQCTATVWARHLCRAMLLTGQTGSVGLPPPHCMKDCELYYLTCNSVQRQAIRKGSSGEP